MQHYTVVGLYGDNNQRYATSVQAESPREAESIAREQCDEDNGFETNLLVAGVVRGRHTCVDAEYAVYGSDG